MNIKSRRAFSLVEVMMLFLITSLIMAASLPFITRASRPIPKKIAHGMYRCYTNGASYVEQYYNSYTMISSNVVNACKFEVPKGATLFKIDLVGAGAGGFNYVNVSDEDEELNAAYYMDNGLEGDVYAKPSEEMLKKMFGNLVVKLCHTVDAATAGQDLKYTAFLPENFNCTSLAANKDKLVFQLNNSTSTDNKLALTTQIENIDNQIKSLNEWAKQFQGYMQTPALNEQLTKYCIDNGYGKNISFQGTEKYVQGGNGGYGGNISHSYTISSYSPYKNLTYAEYLKYLKNGYVLGYCNSKSDCSKTFRKDSKYDPQTYSVQELSNILITSGKYSAKNGTDVNEVSAIKTINGSYITNNTPAKGGVGAAVNISSDGKIEDIRGTNGAGATGTTYCSKQEPFVKIKTNFNKKVHTLGMDGGAGKYKTIYSSNLGDYCTFKIHDGGPAYEQGDVTPTPEELGTTIVCGDFTANVLGGEYNSYVWERKHSIAEKWAGPETKISPFVTSPKIGSTDYKSNYFWLNYNLGQSNFGKGGDGSGVTDKCTEPTGYYEYSVYNRYSTSIKYPNSTSYRQNFNRQCENNGEWIEKTNATKGNGGAVVIVW